MGLAGLRRMIAALFGEVFDLIARVAMSASIGAARAARGLRWRAKNSR